MKIIRLPDNSISGCSRDLLVSEALYKKMLQTSEWISGDGCCTRGFRIWVDSETKKATLESRCSQEIVDIEILPGPPEEQSPTRIPELILTLY